MSVVVTYLEMNDRSWLRTSQGGPQLELRLLGEPCGALNRFFYAEVGKAFAWTDRLSWSEQEWATWVGREQLSTWIGWAAGNPIGYAELDAQGRDTELAYFGLMPQFIGRGYGAAMLSQVAEAAWQRGAARVWLHTCTLDHPAALRNYEHRGFRRFKEEQEPAEDPVRSS